ncbi:hypothetical protein CONCODRAFT_67091 [Conidiobolus coronatus NRRL 28638]|uniref:Uncharacterized protein n=1 Tax=Conidiobolus coronatus (strain ATCC 28846 / CBS 209.66 / NRRL 28638) TaxID=796925 RepID=A0A137PJD2_CONC2|nr:hypothetical protein CONCODRAFT_67091 [Conidiobolus coronatus NRRL 28638]|eukprot:KXN75080.1 hypothetical protein CONCODRAFT_67091 [Conidiobolus coronatus NRRL 28638]
MTANKRKKMNYTNTGNEGRKTGIKLPEYTSSGTSKEQIDYIFDEANAEHEASTMIDVSFRKKEAIGEEEIVAENNLSFQVDPDESFYIPETSHSWSKTKTNSSPHNSNSKSPRSKSKSKIDTPTRASKISTPSPIDRTTTDDYDHGNDNSITLGLDALDINEETPSRYYEILPRLIAANQKSTPSKSPKLAKSPTASNEKQSSISPRKSQRLATADSPSKRQLNKISPTKNNKLAESEPSTTEKKLKSAKAPPASSPKKATNATKQKPKARFSKPTQTASSQDKSEEPGLRRSARTRIQPLKFWENERMVYKFETIGSGMVPVLKEVIKTDEAEEHKISTKSKKRGLERSTNLDKKEKKLAKINNIKSYYENISDKKRFIKPPAAVVDDYETDTVVAQDIHYPYPALGFDKDSHTSQTRKTYIEPKFFSAGVISIQAGGGKELRNTRHNLMVLI